ncbi:MAG: hypothetical protein AB1405_02935, partial [Bdellovibrionota bacterium]
GRRDLLHHRFARRFLLRPRGSGVGYKRFLGAYEKNPDARGQHEDAQEPKRPQKVPPLFEF